MYVQKRYDCQNRIPRKLNGCKIRVRPGNKAARLTALVSQKDEMLLIRPAPKAPVASLQSPSGRSPLADPASSQAQRSFGEARRSAQTVARLGEWRTAALPARPAALCASPVAEIGLAVGTLCGVGAGACGLAWRTRETVGQHTYSDDGTDPIPGRRQALQYSPVRTLWFGSAARGETIDFSAGRASAVAMARRRATRNESVRGIATVLLGHADHRLVASVAPVSYRAIRRTLCRSDGHGGGGRGGLEGMGMSFESLAMSMRRRTR